MVAPLVPECKKLLQESGAAIKRHLHAINELSRAVERDLSSVREALRMARTAETEAFLRYENHAVAHSIMVMTAASAPRD